MRQIRYAGWIILAFLVCWSAPERGWAMGEGPAVGKLVSVQGQVAIRRSGTDRWQPAQVNELLYAGDAVRTVQDSRAAILCSDETQLRLNENTVVILKSIAPSPRLKPVAPVKEAPPPASQYEVPAGEIWLRNKHEKFRFEIDTPAVTATIRGTELNIRVGAGGATTVILLDGKVCLVNPQGEVCLVPGEEGYSLPGQKPIKRMLVQPADAVQWVLYYPGIISYRDLPLTPVAGVGRTQPGPPALASLIQAGEAAYDQGRLQEAKEKAEAVLARDPGNSRALTLLGWVSLQLNAPNEALRYFRQVPKPDDLTVVGLALARCELGDVTGAYEFIRAAGRKEKPSPLMAAMSGYFALMAGKVEEARVQLEAAVSLPPPAPRLARPLLAQIYLVQNKKDAARGQASQALAQAPNSAMALFSQGLVKMAYFDLPAAIRYMEKAIDSDPRFVDAYVYLAKIWLGSEYLSRAQKTINKALHLAPRDPEVLSLAGFVCLAYRDYSGAFSFFNRAVQADPRFGEPHLGLAIYNFRYRDFRRGLEEMLTATLLDPRVASYQTELGKALYQTKSIDRSLEIFDYAKTLDPRDPSPYFYKGLALTDLNRPGEAIQEINQAIELNDNVAMFRGRSLLDQDLAVRNASLAKSYLQLGLTDWGLSKAVTAIKYNPFNPSAHLFLSDVLASARTGAEAYFIGGGQLFTTLATESTLFAVLSRANQATFSSQSLSGMENLGLTSDYTPMFEMPYARAELSPGVGASEGSKLIQDHQALAYGGTPGAAFSAYGRYQKDQRANPPVDSTFNSFDSTFRAYGVQGFGKYEPTVQGTLTGIFIDVENRTNQQFSIAAVSDGFPLSFTGNGGTLPVIRSRGYQAAYYHRFNPEAAFLAYFAHRDQIFHNTLSSTTKTLVDLGLGVPLPFTQTSFQNSTFDFEYNNVQLQQHLLLSCLGQHKLIAGFDYFSGGTSQRFNESDNYTIDFSPLGMGLVQLPSDVVNQDFRPPMWSYSFYLQDYWRLQKNLVLELALWKSFQKDTPNVPPNVYTSMWSPRFGVNYQFGVGGTQHVLRGVLERHLTTHLIAQSVLVPSEIAGFPWVLDATSGSEVRQAGAAWEAQWNSRTFTVLRLNALRVATPSFVTSAPDVNHLFQLDYKRYQASLVLNRILTPSLGLALGVLGKRVIPDLSFAPSLESYSELNAFLSLAYLHPQGWLARFRPLLIQQYGKLEGHQAWNPFVIANLTLGREFPNKRGFALFEIQNLFNRHPFYSLEPRRDLDFPSQRRYLVRLGFYF